MNKIFENLPFCEVAFRWLYKRYQAIFSKKQPNSKKKRKNNQCFKLFDKGLLFNYLRETIKLNDVVILHTKMSEIKKFGISPSELLSFIENLLGPEGTLVVPTMPIYPIKHNWPNYNETQDETLVYNVKTSKPWTGIVGSTFLAEDNVKRSLTPYCTLAAKGKYSDYLFENELDCEYIFEKGSPWEKLLWLNAKVLFLGCDAANSITEIHMVEDMKDIFYVKNWHREQEFLIQNEGNVINKKYWIRKDFWNQYLIEGNNIKKLRDKNILYETNICGCVCSYIPDFQLLTNYQIDLAKRNKNSIFSIPKKYNKKL